MNWILGLKTKWSILELFLLDFRIVGLKCDANFNMKEKSIMLSDVVTYK